MPHSVTLIHTIAAALGLALVLGFLAARLRLPALVGYLLAGVAIGPFTPGFVADAALASQLAEIGVMLLMFGVGLHFSWGDLLAVRKIAVPGAVVQMMVATSLGMALALWWGWGMGGALVLGLALSVASTVVLLRALETLGILDSYTGRIAVGWLVVEDLAMVLVLVLLPPLGGWLGGGSGADLDAAQLWRTLGWTLLQVGGFVALMLLVGRRLFPWLLWQVARTGSLARQVVLVGYGRVGRRVAATLAANDSPFVVAEQNRELVEALRADGVAAVFGDAVEPSVLIQAHIARAAMLVVTTPDALQVRQMIETAQTLNPGVDIVVRSHNEDEAQRLVQECRHAQVFLAEDALAQAMTCHVLERARDRQARPTRPAPLHGPA